ncbi:MAG: hypothetical protein VXZ29_02160, partial [Pseudomonadota bacterium]|nr:hypothetical protein [Pseudomonadota bacterium]
MKNSTLLAARGRTARPLVFLCVLALAGITSAQNPALDLQARRFLDTPATPKYAVIMTGPAGGDDNAARLRQWSLS